MKLAPILITYVAGVTLSAAGLTATAQSVSSAQDGIYTAPQARRGELLYKEHCENCHGADLAGTPFAPSIGGADFAGRWRTRTAGELFELMRNTMPMNSPGGLSAQQNGDLLAFLLMKANFPAGKSELAAPSDALNQITLGPVTR